MAKKPLSPEQLQKKRSRAAKRGWKTKKRQIRERKEIERLTRENKELRDALEQQKDARQAFDDLDTRRKQVKAAITQKILEDAPLKDLLRIAIDEGVFTPEEINEMGLRETIVKATPEERHEMVREQVQRRMDRARRLYGDTLLEAYLLVDMFEDFGYDAIDKIYDLWESDPELAA